MCVKSNYVAWPRLTRDGKKNCLFEAHIAKGQAQKTKRSYFIRYSDEQSCMLSQNDIHLDLSY